MSEKKTEIDVTAKPASPPPQYAPPYSSPAAPHIQYAPPVSPQQQYSPPMSSHPQQYGTQVPPQHQPYGTPAQYAMPPGQMVTSPKLGTTSVIMDCPFCRATVQTSTESRVGGATWLWAVAGCIVTATCGIPCIGCALPFCIDGCKDVEHTCPACGHTIGKYTRL